MCSDTIGTISGFEIEDTTIYVQMDIKSVYNIPQSASLKFNSLTLFTDPVLWRYMHFFVRILYGKKYNRN